MKKILVIEPSGKLYGSEMVLWDIVKNKSDKNIKYIVALPPNSELTYELKSIDVDTAEILDINRGFLSKILSYLKLFFFVLKNDIQLLFINQSGILRSIAIIAFLTKKPIACQVSTLEDCPWLNTLNPFYKKSVKTFICNSRFIADQLKVENQKKSILYYGYHWKNLNPTLRTENKPFHIVLLGRISISKGHFLLVKAISELKKQGVNDLRVFFVGAAPNQQIDNEIKLKISNSGLDDLFCFRGFHKNIEQELSDKNLMVIPSINEPFGRIFCETAESKIPVIVANSGGLGELAKEFELGLTFEANNEFDLAEKIKLAMLNYSIVKMNFEKQSQIMLKKLDMSEYIKVVEGILLRSINGQNSSITWLGLKNEGNTLYN